MDGRLKTQTQEIDEKDKKSNVENLDEGCEFNCMSCNLNEKAHYKGTKPPFSRNIILKYPSYVMKDPFSPPGKGEILILGADCSICNKPVCISKECSIFYTKLFCLGCAKNSIEKFPVELRNKLNQYKKYIKHILLFNHQNVDPNKRFSKSVQKNCLWSNISHIPSGTSIFKKGNSDHLASHVLVTIKLKEPILKAVRSPRNNFNKLHQL